MSAMTFGPAASERIQGAQTATRRALVRRPQVLAVGSQGTHAAAPHCGDGASSRSRSEPLPVQELDDLMSDCMEFLEIYGTGSGSWRIYCRLIS